MGGLAILAASLGWSSSLLAQTSPSDPRATVPTHTAPASTPTTRAETAVFTGVLLLGSTALAPSRVTPYVAPYIGRPVDSALLQQIRLAVSSAFDDAGLGLVSVDTPLMQGSVALVRVQQLSLGQLVVSAGDRPATPALQAQAAAALPALRAGETPNLKALDRQLRLANLQPHRRWAVDFRAPDAAPAPEPTPARATVLSSQPGQSIAAAKDIPQTIQPIRLPGFSSGRPSAATVEARIAANDDDALFGRVTLDNAGQPSTGRERLRVQLGHGDLFGPGRSLDLTALVSVPYPDRQQQLALRYQHPLPELGTLLTAEVSRSRSKPGLVSGFFDVSGSSQNASLSARYLLARQGALEPYIEASLENAVYDDVVNFFGVNLGSKVGTAPLALSLGATWQGGPWNAFGHVRVRHNTGWGTAASAAEYAAARFGSKPDWTTLDAIAEARRAMGSGQEAVARLQGQLTRDALISPQQFRAGGQNIMRGLRESEMSGDSGIALAFEYWWALGAGHRLGGLVDTARSQRNQALAAEPGSSSATSAGAAWQWEVMRGLRLNATAARVIAADKLPLSRKGDSQLHVLLDWAF